MRSALSHRVDPNELKAGDHIYTWRTAYTHHGVYVGKNMVAHFIAPENKSGSVSSGRLLHSSHAFKLASCSKSAAGPSPAPELSHLKSLEYYGSSTLNCSRCSLASDQNLFSCLSLPDCGFRLADSGVVISCLDCFVGTGKSRMYRYGVTTAGYYCKVRGTCTTAQSDPPQEVIHRAMYLLQNNIFGDYHLFRNNCEDFALYCKTGLLIKGDSSTGCSGQTFWKPDLGLRHDVAKVEVEDMPSFRAEL
uniref:protein LEAD-SENSITIVE 1-like n=1 Tax=Erigeron canadensis TaxID=72917 RepID=UPI001CB8D82E|nr:protein LEAD-SENSITIVE 1-like [Erigeron canadensis]